MSAPLLVVTPQPDLCRFFTGLNARWFGNRHVLPSFPNASVPAGLLTTTPPCEPFYLDLKETAKRTRAPAKVPGIRCELDRPKKRKPARGKARKRVRK